MDQWLCQCAYALTFTHAMDDWYVQYFVNLREHIITRKEKGITNPSKTAFIQ